VIKPNKTNTSIAFGITKVLISSMIMTPKKICWSKFFKCLNGLPIPEAPPLIDYAIIPAMVNPIIFYHNNVPAGAKQQKIRNGLPPRAVPNLPINQSAKELRSHPGHF
jgi:hypothetical protein